MGKTGASIAGVKATSDENKAQIDVLASWKSTITDENGELKLADSVAGVEAKANAQGAYLASLASYDLCDVVKFEILGEKPSGTYYTQKPNYDSSGEQWKFATYDADDKNWINYESLNWSDYTEPENGTDDYSYYAPSGTLNTYYQYAYTDEVWSKSELGRNSSSIAGVKSTADANKAELDAMAAYDKNGTSALAGITAYVDENSAQISQLAKYDKRGTNDTTASTGVAGLIAQVTETKATVSTLASLNGDVSGLIAQVNANSASVTTLASHIIGDYTVVKTWSDMSKEESKIYYAEDTQYYWYYDGGWKYTYKPYETKPPLSGALAGIQQTADDNAASIEMITNLEGDFGESLAGLVSKTTSENAEIKALAEYKYTDKDGKEHTSVAALDAYADDNKASIDAIVGKDGSIAGLQAQVDANRASVSTLASQTIGDYVTVDGWNEMDKNASTVYYAKDTKHYYYYKDNEWVSTMDVSEAGLDGAVAGVKNTADANKAELDALASYQAKDEDGNPIYSVAGIMAHVDKNTSELATVATYEKDGKIGLAGLIAQVNADKAVVETVAELDGGIAGLDARVTDNASSVTTLASQTIGDYIIEREDWNVDGKNPQKIYYAIKTKDYYYYKNNQWIATKDINEAGLNGTIAGVKSTADANKAQFDAMAALDTENGNVLAGITAYVDENSAQISHLAKYDKKGTNDTKPTTGVAGLIAQVTENKSIIESLAKLEGDGFDSLGGLVAQVNENKSDVALVSRYMQGNYTIISELVDENKRNEEEFYYDSENKKYWYYDTTQSNWIEIDIFTSLPISQDMIYYVSGTELYWHYVENENGNGGSWQDTTSAYEAGLPSSIGGIQIVTDKNSSAINSLTSWQGETDISMARIEQKADANGAYIQSTVSNMDKYSVGPHSQAYGFTLEQAESVLEEGMIYVPTVEVTETYEYLDEQDNERTYTRDFAPQYLYKWGIVGDHFGWITVDKDYVETEINVSSQAVYFTTTEPVASGNFGYWYTNGDTITGTTGTYEPYTLYKWSSYVDNDGETQYHWIAVATLAGNSSNRAVSQIRQDANSIELDVTNVKGDLAGIKIWAGDDFSAIQDTVTWKTNNSDAIATTIQRASDSEAYIAQVASVKNSDGTVNAAASIVAAVNDAGTSVVIEADHINLNGAVTANNNVTISTDGKITAVNANITGNITATDGNIGGFTIKDGKLYAGSKDSMAKSTHNGVYIGTDGISVGGILQSNPDLTTYYANVTLDASTGKLIANNAEITGKITASSGYIGSEISGFAIGGQAIYNVLNPGGVKSYMISPSGLTGGPSVAPELEGQNYNYVYVGSDGIGTTSTTYIADGTCDITAKTYIQDGKIYSNSAEITGDIVARSGHIGNLDIAYGGLVYSDDSNNLLYSLDETGFTIHKNIAKIKVGDVVFGYDEDNEQTTIETAGPLAICGANSTKLEFMKSGSGAVSSSGNIYVKFQRKSATSIYVWVTSSVAPLYDVPVNIRYMIPGKPAIEDVVSFTLKAGTISSSRESVEVGTQNRVSFLVIENGFYTWTDMYATDSNDYNTSVQAGIVDVFYHRKAPNFLYVTGNLSPSTTSTSDSTGYNLGDGNNVWNTIFVRKSSVDLSDKHVKKDIEELSYAYDKIFDALQPVSYKFKINNNNRTHIGFIAQDVKDAVQNAGLTTKDFAAYCEWNNEHDEVGCGLRYSEFVALNTDQIQKLKVRVAELENKLALLTGQN
jgi:hypothetical protein